MKPFIKNQRIIRSVLLTMIILVVGFFFLRALCTPPDLSHKSWSSAKLLPTEEISQANAESLLASTPEPTVKIAGGEVGLFEFNQKDYLDALAGDKLIVLYFYANWCPSCRREFKQLTNIFNEFTDEKLIGFRVNFKDSDTSAAEEAITRQFGVAYQHTKVFMKNGKQVLKAPDSWGHEQYEREIYQWLE